MKITGGAQLSAFLQQLPVNIERNVLRGGLRAGAKVIQKEAKANVPAKSGKLRRAIKVDTVSGDGQVKARVKLRGEHSFLGVFMEYGVSPHVIQARGTGLSARKTTQAIKAGSLKIGENFVGQVVFHPGFAPKPFLRPALDLRAADAVRAVGEYMANRLKIGSLSAPTIEVEDD